MSRQFGALRAQDHLPRRARKCIMLNIGPMVQAPEFSRVPARSLINAKRSEPVLRAHPLASAVPSRLAPLYRQSPEEQPYDAAALSSRSLIIDLPPKTNFGRAHDR